MHQWHLSFLCWPSCSALILLPVHHRGRQTEISQGQTTPRPFAASTLSTGKHLLGLVCPTTPPQPCVGRWRCSCLDPASLFDSLNNVTIIIQRRSPHLHHADICYALTGPPSFSVTSLICVNKSKAGVAHEAEDGRTWSVHPAAEPWRTPERKIVSRGGEKGHFGARVQLQQSWVPSRSTFLNWMVLICCEFPGAEKRLI